MSSSSVHGYTSLRHPSLPAAFEKWFNIIYSRTNNSWPMFSSPLCCCAGRLERMSRNCRWKTRIISRFGTDLLTAKTAGAISVINYEREKCAAKNFAIELRDVVLESGNRHFLVKNQNMWFIQKYTNAAPQRAPKSVRIWECRNHWRAWVSVVVERWYSCFSKNVVVPKWREHVPFRCGLTEAKTRNVR